MVIKKTNSFFNAFFQLLLIGTFIFPSLGVAQSNEEFASSINKSKLFQNEYLVLTLSLKGDYVSASNTIEPPDLSPAFSIVSSGQSSSISLVNGQMTRSKSIQYTLQPELAGVHIIDPFRITVNGKSLGTRPIRVTVREGNAPSSSAKPPQISLTSPFSAPTFQQSSSSGSIFLETHVSTTNIWIGQSIDYSVKLLRRVSVWSSISIDQADIPSVWQDSHKTTPERVVNRNGRRYYEIELVNKTFRPLSTGNMVIPPLKATFIVDPFSGQQRLQTSAISVTVNALPSPIPTRFSGAIGEFTMELPTQPSNTQPSSSITIPLIITGKNLSQTMTPPIIPDTADYRLLISPTIETPSKNSQQFNYLVLPKTSGTIQIPPIEFVYFSPSNNAYITRQSSPVTLNVISNTVAPNEITPMSEQTIRYLHSSSSFQSIAGWLDSPITFVTFATMLLLIWITIFFRQANNQSKPKAKAISRRHIQGQLQQLSNDATIEAMTQVLINTLQFTCNYPYNRLTQQTLRESLANYGVQESLIQSISQWAISVQSHQFGSEESPEKTTHSLVETLCRLCNQLMVVTNK